MVRFHRGSARVVLLSLLKCFYNFSYYFGRFSKLQLLLDVHCINACTSLVDLPKIRGIISST